MQRLSVPVPGLCSTCETPTWEPSDPAHSHTTASPEALTSRVRDGGAPPTSPGGPVTSASLDTAVRPAPPPGVVARGTLGRLARADAAVRTGAAVVLWAALLQVTYWW